jgi:hypothetical protein
MSLADTNREVTETHARSGLLPTAKIVQFKEALRARTEAMGGWAHQRADAVHAAAERRPLATAGLLAGAALIAGVGLGLMLGGRAAGMKRSSLSSYGGLSSRVRGLLRR